ncbi:Hypothetical predicted protein [Marmota monax]|uniref:Uncharacterized protein n=1 Tax=Marmota monax TaxID=9995 RepID=A0A5E4A5S0_MARMO|nr:Hypothetical predicted protein [Marmota monax]
MRPFISFHFHQRRDVPLLSLRGAPPPWCQTTTSTNGRSHYLESPLPLLPPTGGPWGTPRPPDPVAASSSDAEAAGAAPSAAELHLHCQRLHLFTSSPVGVVGAGGTDPGAWLLSTAARRPGGQHPPLASHGGQAARRTWGEGSPSLPRPSSRSTECAWIPLRPAELLDLAAPGILRLVLELPRSVVDSTEALGSWILAGDLAPSLRASDLIGDTSNYDFVYPFSPVYVADSG